MNNTPPLFFSRPSFGFNVNEVDTGVDKRNLPTKCQHSTWPTRVFTFGLSRARLMQSWSRDPVMITDNSI